MKQGLRIFEKSHIVSCYSLYESLGATCDVSMIGRLSAHTISIGRSGSIRMTSRTNVNKIWRSDQTTLAANIPNLETAKSKANDTTISMQFSGNALAGRPRAEKTV